MEEQKQAPQNQPEGQAPAPTEQPPANNQAMDVVALAPQEKPSETPTPEGVAKAPVDAEHPELPSEAEHHEEPHHEAHHKEHHGGPNAAIVATVIIVIALAALATYAFLQTQSKGL